MKQLTSPRTGKMQEIVQGAGNGELEIPDFSFGFMQNDHARIAADVGIQGSKGKEIRLPLFSEFGQQRPIFTRTGRSAPSKMRHGETAS